MAADEAEGAEVLEPEGVQNLGATREYRVEAWGEGESAAACDGDGGAG